MGNGTMNRKSALPKGDVLFRSVTCCLGLALLFAAEWCVTLVQALPSSANSTAVSIYLPHGLGLIAFALCALFPQRAARVRTSKWAVIGLIAIVLVGRFLESFGGALPPGGVFVYAGTAMCSLAESAVMLLWFAEVCRLEPRVTQALLPLSYLVVAFIYFLLMVISPMVATVVICLLPAFSAALLLWCPATDERQIERKVETTGVRWSFPLYPVLLMVIYKFVFYFSLSLTNGPSMYGALGMLLIALVALVATFFFFDAYQPSLLYKLALPLMAVGLLLMAWLDTGSMAATMVTNASNIGFELFIFIALSAVCYRYDINAIWMFGVVKATAAAATIAGWWFGSAFVSSYPVGSFGANVTVIVIIGVLIAISVLFFNDRMVSSTFGTMPHEEPAENGAQPQVVMSYYEDLVWRCEKVSRRYGLTHREEEILELLAQNMSVARIEESLCISNSTAKTHVHHIYEKLNVHSRDEAQDIVAGMR